MYGGLGEEHDGVGQLVADEPCLQRRRLGVDNILVYANAEKQAVQRLPVVRAWAEL